MMRTSEPPHESSLDVVLFRALPGSAGHMLMKGREYMATKRTGKKAAKKAAKKTVRKAKTQTKAKVAPRTKARSSSRTGQGRAETLQAMQRLDPLTKAYQTSGLPPEEARQRALDELGLKAPKD